MYIRCVTIEDIKRLPKIKKNLKEKLSKVLHQIGLWMQASIKKNFEEGGRPVAWAPLAHATIISRLTKKGMRFHNLNTGHSGAGFRILVDSGMLSKAFPFLVNLNRLIISVASVAKAYGAIQHFGGAAGRGRKVRIPSRKFMMIQKEDALYIHETVREKVFLT